MKRIGTAILTAILLLSVFPFTTACSKRPADYLDSKQVVIDNETPYVYSDDTKTALKINVRGVEREYGLPEFAGFCCGSSDAERESYLFFAGYFGNKPIREMETDGKTVYYTVYSESDHQLCYLFLEKNDRGEYICANCRVVDARQDGMMEGDVLPQDLPSAILGDTLPSRCYFDAYTSAEILENNLNKWYGYYCACNTVNIPHSTYVGPNGEDADTFIRCIHRVSFDIERNNNEKYHGYYVYDLYLEKGGGGALYFYHLDDHDYLPTYTYTVIQQEMVPLSAEEVSSLLSLLQEWDFVNHPTWNPEEIRGVDGTYTYVYATGAIGKEGTSGENLIAMWEPTDRYPHYHIRTALEDIVRAHVTVEEGRIYRPELYE